MGCCSANQQQQTNKKKELKIEDTQVANVDNEFGNARVPLSQIQKDYNSFIEAREKLLNETFASHFFQQPSLLHALKITLYTASANLNGEFDNLKLQVNQDDFSFQVDQSVVSSHQTLQPLVKNILDFLTICANDKKNVQALKSQLSAIDQKLHKDNDTLLKSLDDQKNVSKSQQNVRIYSQNIETIKQGLDLSEQLDKNLKKASSDITEFNNYILAQKEPIKLLGQQAKKANRTDCGSVTAFHWPNLKELKTKSIPKTDFNKNQPTIAAPQTTVQQSGNSTQQNQEGKQQLSQKA